MRMGSPGTVRLRTVEPGDQALLERIYAESRADEMAALDWGDAAKADFLRMQFRAQFADYAARFPRASFSVVLGDDRPIGRLIVDRTPGDIRVVDLAVLAAWRGRGIGTALLRGLIAESVSAGATVSLHVEKRNPALRLYRRLGFVEVSALGIYLRLERSPGEIERPVSH